MRREKRHILFNRTYHGIKVWGSQLAVHINNQGRITSINGHYHPSFVISTVARITEDQAVSISQHNISSLHFKNSMVEPIIYPLADDFKMAWKVNVTTIEYPGMFYIIDATNGDILRKGTGIVY